MVKAGDDAKKEGRFAYLLLTWSPGAGGVGETDMHCGAPAHSQSFVTWLKGQLKEVQESFENMMTAYGAPLWVYLAKKYKDVLTSDEDSESDEEPTTLTPIKWSAGDMVSDLRKILMDTMYNRWKLAGRNGLFPWGKMIENPSSYYNFTSLLPGWSTRSPGVMTAEELLHNLEYLQKGDKGELSEVQRLQFIPTEHAHAQTMASAPTATTAPTATRTQMTTGAPTKTDNPPATRSPVVVEAPAVTGTAIMTAGPTVVVTPTTTPISAEAPAVMGTAITTTGPTVAIAPITTSTSNVVDAPISLSVESATKSSDSKGAMSAPSYRSKSKSQLDTTDAQGLPTDLINNAHSVESEDVHHATRIGNPNSIDDTTTPKPDVTRTTRSQSTVSSAMHPNPKPTGADKAKQANGRKRQREPDETPDLDRATGTRGSGRLVSKRPKSYKE
ncbi:hypothetical protein CPB86DRAFT_303207 [Serendipita vermifera]|nr:hypothetical protein CPB86DRAFT_303207 [Serendipita vermifera]